MQYVDVRVLVLVYDVLHVVFVLWNEAGLIFSNFRKQLILVGRGELQLGIICRNQLVTLSTFHIAQATPRPRLAPAFDFVECHIARVRFQFVVCLGHYISLCVLLHFQKYTYIHNV